MQLLAKAPEDRPASAADVARVLRAASIASSTTAAIAPPQRAPATVESRVGARSQRSIDSWLQGLRAFNMFGPTGGAAARSHLDESFAYLTRALAIDPHHARGLCAMGNWHYVAGVSGVAPREESLARGRELIFAALAADDRCAEVHCSLCKLALYHEDDFHARDAPHPSRRRTGSDRTRGAAPVEHRLQDPRPADRRRRRGALGHRTRARIGTVVERVRRRAARRRPQRRSGRRAQARDHAASRLRSRPSSDSSSPEPVSASWISPSTSASRGSASRANAIEPSSCDRKARVSALPDAIRRDVRRELDGLLRAAESVDPFAEHWRRNAGDRIVSGHAELGEWREAMNWVERGYDERPGRLRRMLADMPIDYRGLAMDPRYARLMRVAGLEDMI